MQMSVFTGAWGNARTKSTERMCQFMMMRAKTISKCALLQDMTGEQVSQQLRPFDRAMTTSAQARFPFNDFAQWVSFAFHGPNHRCGNFVMGLLVAGDDFPVSAREM